MTRKTKLEKALAYAAFYEGRKLAPLHAALLEAVEALEFAYNFSSEPGVVNRATEALAKLDKVLEEK